MAKSPEERYQSSTELRKELEKTSIDPIVLNYNQADMAETLVLDDISNQQLRSNLQKNNKPKKNTMRIVGIVALAVLLFAVFSYLGAAVARRYLCSEVSVLKCNRLLKKKLLKTG